MNVALGRLPPGARYGEPAFVDPHFPDTRLTERGRQQAAVASAAAAALAPPPQLLVVSPLTRALQTAELAFATFGRCLCRWMCRLCCSTASRAVGCCIGACKRQRCAHPPGLVPALRRPPAALAGPMLPVAPPPPPPLHTHTPCCTSALPRVAHHHAAERLYLFSDVGRPREQLEAEYPGYCFKVWGGGGGGGGLTS